MKLSIRLTDDTLDAIKGKQLAIVPNFGGPITGYRITSCVAVATLAKLNNHDAEEEVIIGDVTVMERGPARGVLTTAVANSLAGQSFPDGIITDEGVSAPGVAIVLNTYGGDIASGTPYFFKIDFFPV